MANSRLVLLNRNYNLGGSVPDNADSRSDRSKLANQSFSSRSPRFVLNLSTGEAMVLMLIECRVGLESAPFSVRVFRRCSMIMID